MSSSKITLVLFSFVLVFPSLFAQQGETFQSQANLVLVPVQVRSKGQHLPGLKQDQFTVLQDGKPQTITVFEEVRTQAEPLRRAKVGPREFTNQLQGNPMSSRYTVIAIDRINTTTFDMQRLRDGLKRFLKEASDAGEPIRLVAINPTGIEILQDFTTDPKVISLALERSRTPAGQLNPGRASMSDAMQQLDALVTQSIVPDADPEAAAAQLEQRLSQLDRVKEGEQQMQLFQQRTSRISSLAGLQMIAKSLTGFAGRKSLVWASSGYPFLSLLKEGRTSNTMSLSQVSEAGNLDEYTVQLLNQANIAMYPVDARGTQNTAFQVMDPSHKYSATAQEKEAAQLSNQEVITTFEHLASSTGGKACYERTDLSGCFKDAMEDSRDYYMVGFYVDPKLKPGWHKLQVKVSASANVRSRAGFIYTRLDPAQTRQRDIGLELASFLMDPGLPFRGSWAVGPAKGDKKAVELKINVLPAASVVGSDNHLDLEFAGLARAKDGSIAAQFSQKVDRQLPAPAVDQISKHGIDYKNSMDLAPGQYLLRLVVRDSTTGRMGSATTLVTVD